ncbi:MAG: HDIG domain-containing protein [Armatimonadetes bacterium]|nr:HDIG domain-containing protein [Armatimonadota bacterium]
MDKSSLIRQLLRSYQSGWVKLGRRVGSPFGVFSKGLKRPMRHRQRRFRFVVDKQKLFLGIIVSASLFVMLLPWDTFLANKYVAGDVFDRDVYAWRAVEYISSVETERQRERAVKVIEPVYRLVHDVNERVLYAIEVTYRQFRSIAPLRTSASRKLRIAKEKVVLALSDEIILTCLSASPDVLRLMENYTISLAQKELDKGIKPAKTGIDAARVSIIKAAESLNLRPQYRNAVAAIAAAAIEPNLMVDAKATQQLREKIMQTIAPIRKRIKVGELIGRAGNVVTEEHLEKLRALGINYANVMAAALISILITSLIGLSIQCSLVRTLSAHGKSAPEELVRQFRLLATVWLPLLFAHYFISLAGIHEGAIALLSTAAMVTCVLLEMPLLSALLSGFASLLVGMMALRDPNALIMRLPLSELAYDGNSFGAIQYAFQLSIVSFACSIVGIYSTASVHQRAQLIYAGVLIGLTTLFGRLIICTLLGPISFSLPLEILLPFLWRESMLAVVTGIAAPALTLAIIAMLERAFGLVTAFTLLELANSSAGLLRELAERAPGTYQSSLMVAALARAAAEAIGANPMLAYVGGLYHDIGKLKRPHYFSENQRGQNPHDELMPSLSAGILREHVEEGVNIAKQHNLPERIIDFIREHHGTSLMQFFYSKALRNNGRKDEVQEDGYRYPGPKPRSKETALVMLADAVEAAVSSMPDESFRTPEGWERVEKMVDKVIDGKIEDGQLDESPLSYGEITKIREIFKEHLRVSRLQRIQYPEMP